MKRRRWRRVAMWAGLAACVLCISIWFLSHFTSTTVTIDGTEASLVFCHIYEVRLGSIRAFHIRPKRKSIFDPVWTGAANSRIKFELDWLTESWRERLGEVQETARWPSSNRIVGIGSTIVQHYIPLWIPLAILAVPTLLAWRAERRDRQLIAATACPGCSYDLTGNVTGRCPECGVTTRLLGHAIDS